MGQRVVGDRYELIARIGRGGMASVYRARDKRLLREVAVKILDDTDDKRDTLLFFHREARSIAALRHPNIVQIHDYSGRDETLNYIVMELIDGASMSRTLLPRQPLPENVVVATVHAIASALQHAHEQGVVHRDIKPSNVMIDRDGRVLLTDFGIAKAFRDQDRLGETLVGHDSRLHGTPQFMAPEQVEEKKVGPYTDMFALGALTYRLCTTASPFADVNTLEVLRRVIEVSFLPLAQVNRDLSPPIYDLVDRCLTANPALRPTATDVILECERYLFDTHRIGNPQRAIQKFLQQSPALATTEEPVDADGTQKTPWPRPARRLSRLALGLAAAVLLAGAGAAAWLFVRRTSVPEKTGVTEVRTAHVRLEGLPAGTTVAIDGVNRGRAPDVGDIELEPGWHSIVARHPTLGIRQRDVRLSASERQTVRFVFDTP